MQNTQVVLPPVAPARRSVVLARRVVPAALLLVATAASAQTGGTSTIDLTAGVNTFSNGIVSTINTNAGPLFGLLAIAAGFYFIWGRLRSLF